LFDFAFKEYCTRWAYKHPAPADFFRTMEDASGIDLDWFWRAWFYDIEPVDISLDSVTAYRVFATLSVTPKWDTIRANSGRTQGMGNGQGKNRRTGPAINKGEFQHVSKLRNKASGMVFAVDKDTTLRDFYYYYNAEKDTFGTWAKEQLAAKAKTGEPQLIDRNKDLEIVPTTEAKEFTDNFYYELTFSNKGGTVMPIIIQWNFTDGSSEVDYLSAYIWRKNEYKVTKNFVKRKEVASIVVDPFKETADIDESNQTWPKQAPEVSRFELYKQKTGDNAPENSPMRRARLKK